MGELYNILKAANFSGSGDDGSAYAHSLELSINSKTYVMTATLKNTSDETLGTPQTIDLPLETMVVSGAYDNTTKKVILTLKSGNTVDFSVADLVSGLQSEITANNKLSSDLVDDTNHTNKFVTSSEKSAWNGKQDALTFDNSPTANSNNPVKSGGIYTALSGKENTINSSNKLSSDLVDDTNQTNKFVTAAEKTKITNALTEEVYNAGKQVTTGNKTGEIFNDYSSNAAIGGYSHAEGAGTIASGYCQHAQGQYNIEDYTSKYAFIIGNGTSNARSNAFAVDWNGLIYVNNSVTGVDVSNLATRLTTVETTIGNINAVLEEVL